MRPDDLITSDWTYTAVDWTLLEPNTRRTLQVLFTFNLVYFTVAVLPSLHVAEV